MGFRLHCPGVDDRRRVILDGDHGVLNVRPIEGLEGLLQVLRYPMVVDHQAVVLLGGHPIMLVREAPVHPGHRLQQPVLAEGAVQVEHLLDRGVKPGEQHVHHHQDLGVAVRVDEGVGDLGLGQAPGLLEFRPVAGRRRDDGIGAHPEVVEVIGSSGALPPGWAPPPGP